MTGTELAISCIPGIIAGIISGIFGGGLLGPWRQHKLAERREKAAALANRKRDFMVFMEEWRVEVLTTPGMIGLNNGVQRVCKQRIAVFQGKLKTVQDCFKNIPEFRRLAENVSTTILNRDTWTDKGFGRKPVLDAITLLIAFAERN